MAACGSRDHKPALAADDSNIIDAMVSVVVQTLLLQCWLPSLWGDNSIKHIAVVNSPAKLVCECARVKGKMSHLHFVFICCVASQLPQEKTGGIELIVPVVHSSNAAGAVDELVVVINSFNQVCCLLQTTKKMLILTCLDCCKAWRTD